MDSLGPLVVGWFGLVVLLMYVNPAMAGLAAVLGIIALVCLLAD